MNSKKEWGQNYAVSFVLSKKKARIVYPPGFGKSRIVTLLCKALIDLEGRINVLIVTDSVASRDMTWPEEFKKWGLENVLISKQVKICRYDDLEKHLGEYLMIVCDEAHKFTETSSQLFYRCKAEYKVFMTATEPNRDDKPRMASFFKYVIPDEFKLEISVDQAIAMGAINDYIIRIFEYDVPDSEYAAYLDICKSIQKARINKISKLEEIYRIVRMNLVYGFESKIKVTLHLKQRLKGKRMLIFTMRKKAAEALSPNTYHSDTGPECLEAFKAQAIKELATVESIRYGANFENLRYILCSQINSLIRDFTQILGRGFRLDEKDVVECWIVVARNTVDADWVAKATKTFDKRKIFREYINYNSV